MYYLSKSLSIDTYSQSGCRRYWNVASLEMHLEAEIEKLRDALGDRNGASLGMHLEAAIV